jgi:hypothetical protein
MATRGLKRLRDPSQLGKLIVDMVPAKPMIARQRKKKAPHRISPRKAARRERLNCRRSAACGA